MACYIDKHKELLSMLKYYGPHDIVSSIFAKNIVSNIDSLESDIESVNCNVIDLISLYQYMWNISFIRFSSDINEYSFDGDIKSRIKLIVEKN